MIKKLFHKFVKCTSKVTSSANISYQIETFFHPLRIQIRSRCLSEYTREIFDPFEDTMKNVENLVEILISFARFGTFFAPFGHICWQSCRDAFNLARKASLEFCWLEFLAQVIFVWFITLLRYPCPARRKSKTLIGKCVWMISAIFASNSRES